MQQASQFFGQRGADMTMPSWRTISDLKPLRPDVSDHLKKVGKTRRQALPACQWQCPAAANTAIIGGRREQRSPRTNVALAGLRHDAGAGADGRGAWR